MCALVYVDPVAGEERLFEGESRGRMAKAPRGSGGFGYDPIFQIGDGRTMAEMSESEKDAISHRGRAARLMAEWLATGSRR